MSYVADFLLEETCRHIIECLSVQKQTSNYLSCFLWETQHPTAHGDDSCDFFLEGLHHSKEIHLYVSHAHFIFI